MANAFLAIAIVALLLALPVWPYSRGWGWSPALMVGVILGTAVLFGFAGGVWS